MLLNIVNIFSYDHVLFQFMNCQLSTLLFLYMVYESIFIFLEIK